MSTAIRALLLLICGIAGGAHFLHWGAKVGSRWRKSCKETNLWCKCCKCCIWVQRHSCCRRGGSGDVDVEGGEIPVDDIPLRAFIDSTRPDPDKTDPKSTEMANMSTSLHTTHESSPHNIESGNPHGRHIVSAQVHVQGDPFDKNADVLSGNKKPPISTTQISHPQQPMPHSQQPTSSCSTGQQATSYEEPIYSRVKGDKFGENTSTYVTSPPVPPRKPNVGLSLEMQQPIYDTLKNIKSVADNTRSHHNK